MYTSIFAFYSSLVLNDNIQKPTSNIYEQNLPQIKTFWKKNNEGNEHLFFEDDADDTGEVDLTILDNEEEGEEYNADTLINVLNKMRLALRNLRATIDEELLVMELISIMYISCKSEIMVTNKEPLKIKLAPISIKLLSSSNNICLFNSI